VDTGLIFSIIGAAVTLGGVCVAFGVLKAKIVENEKEVELKASKTELASAIKHSDALLEMMQKRAEEDRARGEARYKELHGITSIHGERISALETSQNAVIKSLDELKLTVNNGFREVREDLKEMRKQG
jgi:hypothetical protein